MKRFVFFILIAFCVCHSSYADITIQMEEYNGVYRIPCTVNGAKMKFIFDTGASNVCLSMTMAEYLYDNGYIDDEDIKGVGSSSVADGRIVDHIKLILKDIQIGDLHINNVEAVVVAGQNAPLLMGQSAIQKFGSYEINGNVLTIHNDNIGGSFDDYVQEIHDKLVHAMANERFDEAYKCFDILYDLGQLDDFELYSYATRLYIEDKCEKSLEILNSIDDIESLIDEGWDVYSIYAGDYFDLSDYSKAIKYKELSGDKFLQTWEDVAMNQKFIADCYYYQEQDKQAYDCYLNALIAYAKSFDIEPEYLLRDCKGKLRKNQKSYRNDEIDLIAYRYASTAALSGVWTASDFADELKSLAKAGNRYAIQHFNESGVNPYDY